MSIKNNKICILGMGYVGLTLAVTLADEGFDVLGVDVNKKVVQSIKKGKPHFFEIGLQPLLKKHINKKLNVNTKITNSDIYIICVGTPVDNHKKPRMGFVKRVCKDVGKILKKGDLVILRSTVPIGMCRNHVLPILENESGLTGSKDFYISFAPERTIEGRALKELRELPQIIGGLDKESIDLTSNLFRKVIPTIINVNSLENAEMIKLVNNTFRDVTFAYSNELSLICDKLDLNTVKIINAANLGYPRGLIPVPSPGVGGTCLVKDSYLLAHVCKKLNFNPKMIILGRKINEFLPLYVARKMVNYLKLKYKNNIRKAKIFVMGFAFKGKPETSDMRDSPTIDLVRELQRYNNNIYGYDPLVPKEQIESLGVNFCSISSGFKNAACVIIMNNHPSYEGLDIFKLISLSKKPLYFFDGWQIFKPEEIKNIKGVIYGGLGNE